MRMLQAFNGMPAQWLTVTAWRKSRHSNPSGSCFELAALPDEEIAVRNSRHPGGPALIFTADEIAAFVRGAKDGEFDDLLEAAGADTRQPENLGIAG
ncbi:DUF397 domain-containing protein [Actinocorallia lasiicapitis]